MRLTNNAEITAFPTKEIKLVDLVDSVSRDVDCIKKKWKAHHGARTEQRERILQKYRSKAPDLFLSFL